MKKSKNKKNRRISLRIVVMILIAYAASLVVGGFNYLIPTTYDLSVGNIAPRDFFASRQVENIYLTQRNRDDAAALVEPVFQHDPAITAEILDSLQNFFADTGAARAALLPIISPFSNLEIEPAQPSVSHHNTILTDEQFRHITMGSSSDFARFMNTLTEYVEQALNEQILSIGSVSLIANGLQESLAEQGFDDVMVSIGYDVVLAYLRPNMVENVAETERQRQEAMDAAPVESLQSAQNIVRSGDTINMEAYLILVELGIIGISAATIISGLAGSWLVVTIVFGIAIFYVFIFKKEIITDKRQATILFTLFTMTLILLRVMAFLPFYFTPIMLFAILCAILIDTRLSVVVTLVLSMIAVVIDPMNAQFAVYALINGVLAALIAKKIVVRSNMWIAAGVFVLANAATAMASYFLFTAGFSEQMFPSALLAMVGGVMTITLAYGSLPIWESIFKVVTQNTLLELTDPNNALLRRLLIETPGTYHHSLVVANLAEAACLDIEANHVLARVGAYYHDIGKMSYPQYFAENQTDHNPHDSLPPRTSVDVINNHVIGGMKLAHENNLPEPVRDFIEQHHGTSMMKVFFHKEKTANENAQIDEADFRYANRIPQTKETAVVMLADVCEAAVRAVFGKGDKDSSEIEPFVRKLIKDKLDDGQLNESELSIKDLETIVQSFMRVFKGMHHERVPYPAGTVKELTTVTPEQIKEAFKRG